MTVEEIITELNKLKIYGGIERNNPRQKVLGFSLRHLCKVVSPLQFLQVTKPLFTLTVLYDMQTEKVTLWHYDNNFKPIGNGIGLHAKICKILN